MTQNSEKLLKIAQKWGYYVPFDAQGTVHCGTFYDICVPWTQRNLSIVKGPA